jgi:NADH-quinone oxidoreductase subunit K
MAIAAAEAAVGLAILIGVFRTRQTIEVDELDALRDET